MFPKEIRTTFVEEFFFHESLAVDLTISTVGLAPRSHVHSYNTKRLARYICILYRTLSTTNKRPLIFSK